MLYLGFAPIPNGQKEVSYFALCRRPDTLGLAYGRSGWIVEVEAAVPVLKVVLISQWSKI